MKKFYGGKKVLVTGGTGLIGRPLVSRLSALGALVTVVSLDTLEEPISNVSVIKADLRELSNCVDVARGKDIVFHLAGVKGSPKMCAEKPASFMVPTVQFNFNMMEAARKQRVGHYLYTSSIGVYAPAADFHEDSVWQTFPSPNDKFAGWAKRLGELQAEAYKVENNWDKISIVRPANVYGRFDNFDPENAMVIPSLISRALQSTGFLEVWGDGTPLRDFIHADDVAEGMLKVVEMGYSKPVNLGSGVGVRIRDIAEAVAKHVPNGPLEIKWDKSKPSGDAKRLMNTSRAESLGIEPKVSLSDGIKDTIDWFFKNKDQFKTKYNSFVENV